MCHPPSKSQAAPKVSWAWLVGVSQHCAGKEEGANQKTRLFQGIDSDKDGHGLEAGDCAEAEVRGSLGQEGKGGQWRETLVGRAWARRTSFCRLVPGDSSACLVGTLGELGEERSREHLGGEESVVQRCPAMAYGNDLTWAAPYSQTCVFRVLELGRLWDSSQ